MPAGHTPTIAINLTAAQVRHVVRAACSEATPGLHLLLRHGRAGARGGASPVPRAEDDARLSRSLLRGLSLLARFGPDHAERGVVELAAELQMSASTAHRYVLTLVEAGLIEQVPGSRKYRLAGR
jgi:DNA-binding MarR family transcriptional regulator